MSSYANSNRGRAPFPASNRQVSGDLRVDGTSLIYCYGCEKNKPSRAFSETQIKKASSRAKNHQIMCKSCIPAQATTLMCTRCAKTLPMEKFSKTQKRNQEKATCMDCRQYIEDDDSEVDFDLEDDPDFYEGDITEVL